MGMILYSSEEVAEIIGTSERNVRALAKKHGRGQKVGQAWAFTEWDLKWFRSRPKPGGPPGPRPKRRKTE